MQFLYGLAILTSFRDLDEEHVGVILTIMARGLPEIDVEHVRSHNLFVAPYPVLFPDQVHEIVVDGGSIGGEEGAARCHRGEEE